jgi:hypothetical protein
MKADEVERKKGSVREGAKTFRKLQAVDVCGNDCAFQRNDE